MLKGARDIFFHSDLMATYFPSHHKKGIGSLCLFQGLCLEDCHCTHSQCGKSGRIFPSPPSEVPNNLSSHGFQWAGRDLENTTTAISVSVPSLGRGPNCNQLGVCCRLQKRREISGFHKLLLLHSFKLRTTIQISAKYQWKKKKKKKL